MGVLFYDDPWERYHRPTVYGDGGTWKGCLVERYQIVSDGCGEGCGVWVWDLFRTELESACDRHSGRDPGGRVSVILAIFLKKYWCACARSFGLQVAFEEKEWELDQLEKLKEEQEAEIDEDNEPLFYESTWCPFPFGFCCVVWIGRVSGCGASGCGLQWSEYGWFESAGVSLRASVCCEYGSAWSVYSASSDGLFVVWPLSMRIRA